MLRFPVLSAKHPLKLEYFNPNTMEWEVQDTRVFRSFPTADNPTAGVHVKLHHFSTYRFTQAIAEHAVDERFIDAQWSRDWGIGMKDIKFNRGGRPYYVPWDSVVSELKFPTSTSALVTGMLAFTDCSTRLGCAVFSQQV